MRFDSRAAFCALHFFVFMWLLLLLVGALGFAFWILPWGFKAFFGMCLAVVLGAGFWPRKETLDNTPASDTLASPTSTDKVTRP